MEHLRERRFLVSFDSLLIPQVFSEVMVIGSGVAGMRAALAAAEYGEVLIVVKGPVTESNTARAQGGIAGAMGAEDSALAHASDTLAVGHGLCNLEVVAAVTEDGPARIGELIEWGARLDTKGGALALAREGGHSAARIVHAMGDATGKEVADTLLRQVRKTATIQVMEHTFVLDLLTTPDGCVGALVQDPQRGRMIIWAKQTILAAGGAGRIFRETTNSPVATGDGVAMAYRAGAELCDLEFFQFHPTALYVAGASRALISEAVRGEGGMLLNARRERFMTRYHEQGDLAPRDAVSRAIVAEIRATGHTCVFVDMRHVPATRFPGIRGLCAQFDVDVTRDLVPVRPAAHYMIGGVIVDLDGRSSVSRLLVCGEAACTGLHGANRLGSNSLLEGLVVGHRTGRRAGEAAVRESRDAPHPRFQVRVKEGPGDPIDVDDVTAALRAVTWRSLGIERTRFGLEEAVTMMSFWGRYVMRKEFANAAGWELQNMLTVGRLLGEVALMRRESRGVHFRTDFPETDDEHWKVRIVMRQGAAPERRAAGEASRSGAG